MKKLLFIFILFTQSSIAAEVSFFGVKLNSNLSDYKVTSLIDTKTFFRAVSIDLIRKNTEFRSAKVGYDENKIIKKITLKSDKIFVNKEECKKFSKEMLIPKHEEILNAGYNTTISSIYYKHGAIYNHNWNNLYPFYKFYWINKPGKKLSPYRIYSPDEVETAMRITVKCTVGTPNYGLLDLYRNSSPNIKESDQPKMTHLVEIKIEDIDYIVKKLNRNHQQKKLKEFKKKADEENRFDELNKIKRGF